MKNKTNVVLPILLTIIAVLLVFLIILAVMILNKPQPIVEKPIPDDEPKIETDFELPEDPLLQPVVYDDPNEVRYYVRTSYNDTASQVGSFHYFENAMKCADKYAKSGYEVYNIYGDLVYAPIYTKTTFYRVRTSANDAKSQIGAFENIYNAIDLAEKNKNSGYKVYDDNGNLIYAPVVTIKAPQADPQPAKPTNEVLYRVRKSANDASSQLGAFKELDNAKKLADKNSGYEVYDQDGNLIYTPVASTYVAPSTPNNTPNVTPSQSTQPSGDVLYRVRKSANDASSQLGAFKDFNNAKNLADQNSGYQVYDQNGNLAYAP